MKKAKKLASLLLALVLLFALAVPAMAANGVAITVKGPIAGETYYLFKMFDLSYSTTVDDNGTPGDTTDDKTIHNYVYTISNKSPWYGLVSTAPGNTFVELSEYQTIYNADNTVKEVIYSVSKISTVLDSDFPGFATAARDYLDKQNINDDGTLKNPLPIPSLKNAVAVEGQDVVFDGLDYGYYMVYGTMGTVVALKSNHTAVTISNKNNPPTDDKEVQEDSSGLWGSVSTAEIGEVVPFRGTIEKPNNLRDLVYHDVMSKGLTLDETSIKVYRVNSGSHSTEPTRTEVGSANYTFAKVTNSTELTGMYEGGLHWTISFAQSFIDNLSGIDSLEIVYNATVNAGALITGTSDQEVTDTSTAYNPNKSQVTYGRAQSTVWNETKTFVFDVEIFKYTSIVNGDQNHPLAGAEFQLRKGVLDVNNKYYPVYAVVEKLEGEGNTYRLKEWATEESKASKLVSDASGLIRVTGLDSDLYRLIETKAPEGYKLRQAPVQFKISQEGLLEVNIGSVNDTNYVDFTRVEVLNSTGAQLPSTGGIGTTMFYIIGAALMLGAVVILVTKKRMSEN